jgi:predicted TIM-barrel fold metal-dependent hydrolase
MSAIFRAYNEWLAEFYRTDPARLKGIAMINLDDVEDGIKELERAARLGLSGAYRVPAQAPARPPNPNTSRSGPPPRHSACR